MERTKKAIRRTVKSIDFSTGKTTFKEPTILTNDPSVTAWGWAVVDWDDNILAVGCIKTEPDYKKKRIRKGDDTVRRVSEINYALLGIMQAYHVQLLLSELPHGSQNASAAVMIGIVTGVLQTLADIKGLPIEWYSEGDAKKHLAGTRSLTKQETIDRIAKIYKVPWTNTKYRDEAIADALAIYHIAKYESSVIKMMKKRQI